jgi:hypothetical protein
MQMPSLRATLMGRVNTKIFVYLPLHDIKGLVGTLSQLADEHLEINDGVSTYCIPYNAVLAVSYQ